MDTSSAVGSVALLEDEKVLMELSLRLEKQYSTNLIPLIAHLLDLGEIKLSDIDGFAVGLGPGSFTGIRVGVTTLKGLVLGTGKPAVGVSSLEALAHDAFCGSDSVVVLGDAKRNLVYFGWYKRDKAGKPVPVVPATLTTLKEALAKVRKPALFVGDAVGLYRKEIQRAKGKKARFAGSICHFPKASVIGKIALENLRKGKCDDVRTLSPIYLYSRHCSIQGRR